MCVISVKFPYFQSEFQESQVQPIAEACSWTIWTTSEITNKDISALEELSSEEMSAGNRLSVTSRLTLANIATR
jgi:hypothetical protein